MRPIQRPPPHSEPSSSEEDEPAPAPAPAHRRKPTPEERQRSTVVATAILMAAGVPRRLIGRILLMAGR